MTPELIAIVTVGVALSGVGVALAGVIDPRFYSRGAAGHGNELESRLDGSIELR